MNNDLANAIFGKIGFRGDKVRRYQAACIYKAMQLYPSEFGADDVPNEFKPQDQTTAGCVFALMKSEGQRIFIRSGRRASKCPSRKSAWLNTYRVSLPAKDKDVLQGQQMLLN
jgi:hypothetical protein